ncbi:hypothetical protein [Paenibacillus aceti]|uniref:hypothetical protein n=1 Tax=Paenibacillus aceti TaxID=1820010 RepID=UPI0013C4668E|nr:hypothetical protein [Paenibacillus aceti]HBF2207824.1 hypothetical protein [Clostridioides difficile]
MEKENDSTIISDGELLDLLFAAKQRDPDAMLQLIDIYKGDILRISKFIQLPKEDAVSIITLEFLEFIQKSEEVIQ